jgi:hypothetical protein
MQAANTHHHNGTPWRSIRYIDSTRAINFRHSLYVYWDDGLPGNLRWSLVGWLKEYNTCFFSFKTFSSAGYFSAPFLLPINFSPFSPTFLPSFHLFLLFLLGVSPFVV